MDEKKAPVKEIIFTVAVVSIVFVLLVVAGSFQRAAEKPDGIGTGEKQFWTTYPASHIRSGQPACHPQWVMDALDGGVVMILSHSELCIPCKNMVMYCDNIYDDHAGSMSYFDLLHGTDEPRASDALSIYDPNPEPNYVPLTIVLTKVMDANGSAVVAWHSWEGEVVQSTLDSWVHQAIKYYQDSTRM